MLGLRFFLQGTGIEKPDYKAYILLLRVVLLMSGINSEVPLYIHNEYYYFFYLGFNVLSRIFYLYRADRSSKVGENRGTRGRTFDHPYAELASFLTFVLFYCS